MSTNLNGKVAEWESLVALGHQIIHGGPTESVETEGGPVRSFAKLMADKDAEINERYDGVLDQAEAAVISAAAFAQTAEVARDAALLSGKLYPTAAAGVNPAGTPPGVAAGEYYGVVSATPGSYVDLYRNVGGVATSQAKSYPSVAALLEVISALSALSTQVFAVERPRTTMRQKLRTVGANYLDGFFSNAGQVLAGLGRDLSWGVVRLRLFGKSASHRSTGGGLFSVGDAAGKSALSIDKAGHTWLRLQSSALALLRTDLALSGVPNFRGDVTAFDIRATPELTRASVLYGKVRLNVVQRTAGLLDTAVADAYAIRGLHYTGQSNSQSSGAAVSVLLTKLYPHNALQFSVGRTSLGPTIFDASTLTDFSPVADPSGLPPYLLTAAAFALAELAIRFGKEAPVTVSRSDGYGGQALGQFVRGTPTWTNLMDTISRSKIVSEGYGKAYQPNIIWVQGEAGPTGRSVYAPQFQAYLDDARSEVVTRTGMLPPFAFYQISHHSCPGVDFAQLDVAKANLGTSIALISPTYAFPMSTDGIHFSAIGRMMMGEVQAVVMDRIWRDGYFTPLTPRSITRSGAVITIDYLNPGLALKADADWIESTPNFGFTYSDSTSSASVSSVAITGPAQVQVTLSAVPTGATKTLSYADAAVIPVDAQWQRRRGHIYAPSGHTSVFKPMGYALPSDIRFNSTSFQEVIA